MPRFQWENYNLKLTERHVWIFKLSETYDMIGGITYNDMA